MFFRAKNSESKDHPLDYLQIVESYRDGSSVRQREIATLGRLDQLKASGQIEELMQCLARFSETLKVVSEAREPKIPKCKATVWGPALVSNRLWEQQKIPVVISVLAEDHKFHFKIEHAYFALSLQHLCEPGSDLRGSHWVRTVECPGSDQLELQHPYRSTGFLHDTWHDLKRELYLGNLNLLNQQPDLLLLDTTSTYVYREEESKHCKRGYSRDHRGDLPQFVLCVAVNSDGWPVAWEAFPGNTAQIEACEQVITPF
jgi:hypothetical protein